MTIINFGDLQTKKYFLYKESGIFFNSIHELCLYFILKKPQNIHHKYIHIYL